MSTVGGMSPRVATKQARARLPHHDVTFLSDMEHHHRRLGSLLLSHALPQKATIQKVTSTQSEVDMQRTTTKRHQGSHDTAAAFWLVAAIIVMIASGDALALLIAAVAIVTVVWGMIRTIERRVRDRTELAPVTHLRPAMTAPRDLKKTSAHGSWHGPRAA
jgi:hypothetical protein